MTAIQKEAYEASLEAQRFANMVKQASGDADVLASAVGGVADEAGRAAMNAAAMVSALRSQAVTAQLVANDGGLNQLNQFNSTPFQDQGQIEQERWAQNFADSQAEWLKRQPKARKGGGAKKTDTMTDEMRDAARVYEETRTALEQYNDELDDLQQLHDMGYLSADTYARAVEKVGEEYRNASEAGQFFNQISEDLKNGILDAIIEGENLSDTFKDIAKSIARAALEASLFGTGPFAGGGSQRQGGGLLGGLLGGLGSLFSFDGGGYTGSGSRSGGVDGRGGFPAILHPNETVVDHSRGQGGGSSDVVKIVLQDDSGRMASIADQQIQTRSGTIVQVAVDQSKSQILPTVAEYQGNRAGSDFRTR